MGLPRLDMKVVLLGKEYCGKTSLVDRFLNHRFSGGQRYQNTIGAAFGCRRVQFPSAEEDARLLRGREVVMGVWDTAGSERYQSMSRIYYRGASAAVVCYDVTDAESWERLDFWVRELRKMEEGCRVYICATKTDLLGEEPGRARSRRRAVDYHNTTDYAEEEGAKLFETSSKTGANVEEMFLEIARDFLSDPKVAAALRDERSSAAAAAAASSSWRCSLRRPVDLAGGGGGAAASKKQNKQGGHRRDSRCCT